MDTADESTNELVEVEKMNPKSPERIIVEPVHTTYTRPSSSVRSFTSSVTKMNAKSPERNKVEPVVSTINTRISSSKMTTIDTNINTPKSARSMTQIYDKDKHQANTIDDLTECQICHTIFDDPHMLPCFHAFCKNCLQAKLNAGNIVCPTCEKEFAVPNNNLDRLIKPSNLTVFLVKFLKNRFDDIDITDDEKKEIDGQCIECNPVSEASKNKEDPNEPAIEPILIKLGLCFHCKKLLCASCRTKHYNEQRKKTLKSLIYFGEGSENIINTSEKLNQARKNKVFEYERAKIDIAERKIQLIERLEKEEINLLKRLDDEVVLENKNVELGEMKLQRHECSRDTTKSVYQKLNAEKNFKRLNELCVDFEKVQAEWKSLLTYEAASIDPNKEKKIVFTPTKLKEDIIGTIDKRKENLRIRSAVIPGPKKSSICTVL